MNYTSETCWSGHRWGLVRTHDRYTIRRCHECGATEKTMTRRTA